MVTVSLQSTEMGGWPPGVRHWAASDGRHFAVVASAELSDQVKEVVNDVLAHIGDELIPDQVPVRVEGNDNRPTHRVAPQPTTIVECLPNGQAYTLDPLFTFPAGTTAEDALRQAGFELEEQ